jgi:hypothetical protein
MKIRKITSLTAGLSFLLMVLTSVVLYIAPQGRVAYWADWRLWGLSKSDWGNIHINMGFLFLLALFLHIYYNWKAITSYLKDRARRIKVFTSDFNVALVVTLIVALGTYLMVPPFSWVIALGERFKDEAAVKYGEPPYGHAELSSLKTFTQKLDLDLANSMDLLESAGYAAENDQVTLAALAKRYRVPPQQLYQTIQTALKATADEDAGVGKLPESPPPGTGNLLLADFCARYNLNLKQVIRDLNAQGIAASADMSIKQIAAEADIGPTDLYEIIKALVKPEGKVIGRFSTADRPS